MKSVDLSAFRHWHVCRPQIGTVRLLSCPGVQNILSGPQRPDAVKHLIPDIQGVSRRSVTVNGAMNGATAVSSNADDTVVPLAELRDLVFSAVANNNFKPDEAKIITEVGCLGALSIQT